MQTSWPAGKQQVMPFCQTGERTRAVSHSANTERGGARVCQRDKICVCQLLIQWKTVAAPVWQLCSALSRRRSPRKENKAKGGMFLTTLWESSTQSCAGINSSWLGKAIPSGWKVAWGAFWWAISIWSAKLARIPPGHSENFWTSKFNVLKSLKTLACFCWAVNLRPQRDLLLSTPSKAALALHLICKSQSSALWQKVGCRVTGSAATGQITCALVISAAIGGRKRCGVGCGRVPICNRIPSHSRQLFELKSFIRRPFKVWKCSAKVAVPHAVIKAL